LKEQRITKEDADLILEFTAERQAIRQLSDGRVNKIIYHLVDWRKYIGVFMKKDCKSARKFLFSTNFIFLARQKI
jgi:hypothetical protein